MYYYRHLLLLTISFLKLRCRSSSGNSHCSGRLIHMAWISCSSSVSSRQGSTSHITIEISISRWHLLGCQCISRQVKGSLLEKKKKFVKSKIGMQKIIYIIVLVHIPVVVAAAVAVHDEHADFRIRYWRMW